MAAGTEHGGPGSALTGSWSPGFPCKAGSFVKLYVLSLSGACLLQGNYLVSVPLRSQPTGGPPGDSSQAARLLPASAVRAVLTSCLASVL